jgi:hypothetical protein
MPASALPTSSSIRSRLEVNAMATVEHGELQVVVPVGFLLNEVREVTVSVERPGAEPLPVRLRLIPARPAETPGVAALVEVPEESVSVSTPTPLRIGRTKRGLAAVDGFGEPEYGGSD